MFVINRQTNTICAGGLAFLTASSSILGGFTNEISRIGMETRLHFTPWKRRAKNIIPCVFVFRSLYLHIFIQASSLNSAIFTSSVSRLLTSTDRKRRPPRMAQLRPWRPIRAQIFTEGEKWRSLIGWDASPSVSFHPLGSGAPERMLLDTDRCTVANNPDKRHQM